MKRLIWQTGILVVLAITVVSLVGCTEPSVPLAKYQGLERDFKILQQARQPVEPEKKTTEKELSAAYEEGRKAGLKMGLDEGEKVGYNKGKLAGYQEGKVVGIAEGKAINQQAEWTAGWQAAMDAFCQQYRPYLPTYVPFPPPRRSYPVYIVPSAPPVNSFSQYFETGCYRFKIDFEGRAKVWVAGKVQLEAISFYYERGLRSTTDIYLSGYQEVRVECPEGKVHSFTWERKS